MEISSEKLNKLTGWKYEEYKTLSEKDFKGKKYKNFISFISQCILCLLAGSIYILVRNENISNWLQVYFVTFLIGIVCPLSWIPIILFSDGFHSKIYQHFSHKTKDYLRLKELEIDFIDIEKDIELEAITILSQIEETARLRLSDNKNINYYLRRKRNPALYTNEIEKVRNNYVLNQKSLLILDKNIDYIKFDLEKLKYFEKLQLNLRFENIHFTGLLSGIGRNNNSLNTPSRNTVRNISVTTKNNSDYQETKKPTRNFLWRNRGTKSSNTSKPSTSNNDSHLSKSKNPQPKDEITTDETLTKATKNCENLKPKENKKIELPESSVFDTQQKINQLEFDFENPKITVKPTNDITKKRNTPKYEPIIKASPKFYLELTSKKIEIGMKGELLVMEHERQRLIEIGENPDIKLLHKSVRDGDGFGYDILSSENGKEIYIEVKTTVGSFWSNLFFTQNEYEKMNEFGEQYYLYRICNLDLETNKGDLFIFGGKEMIDSFFDFKSKMYVLTQKSN